MAEKLPANATGTLEKYNADKPQEVIYYYKLKPAKVIINYLEKDEDTDDSNNLVLTAQERDKWICRRKIQYKHKSSQRNNRKRRKNIYISGRSVKTQKEQ